MKMKKACDASATGFTQKRHTLYAIIAGWAKNSKGAILIEISHADAPKRFGQRGRIGLAAGIQRRGVIPLNFLNRTKEIFGVSRRFAARAMLSMGWSVSAADGWPHPCGSWLSFYRRWKRPPPSDTACADRRRKRPSLGDGLRAGCCVAETLLQLLVDLDHDFPAKLGLAGWSSFQPRLKSEC